MKIAEVVSSFDRRHPESMRLSIQEHVDVCSDWNSVSQDHWSDSLPRVAFQPHLLSTGLLSELDMTSATATTRSLYHVDRRHISLQLHTECLQTALQIGPVRYLAELERVMELCIRGTFNCSHPKPDMALIRGFYFYVPVELTANKQEIDAWVNKYVVPFMRGVKDYVTNMSPPWHSHKMRILLMITLPDDMMMGQLPDRWNYAHSGVLLNLILEFSEALRRASPPADIHMVYDAKHEEEAPMTYMWQECDCTPECGRRTVLLREHWKRMSGATLTQVEADFNDRELPYSKCGRCSRTNKPDADGIFRLVRPVAPNDKACRCDHDGRAIFLNLPRRLTDRKEQRYAAFPSASVQKRHFKSIADTDFLHTISIQAQSPHQLHNTFASHLSRTRLVKLALPEPEVVGMFTLKDCVALFAFLRQTQALVSLRIAPPLPARTMKAFSQALQKNKTLTELALLYEGRAFDWKNHMSEVSEYLAVNKTLTSLDIGTCSYTSGYLPAPELYPLRRSLLTRLLAGLVNNRTLGRLELCVNDEASVSATVMHEETQIERAAGLTEEITSLELENRMLFQAAISKLMGHAFVYEGIPTPARRSRNDSLRFVDYFQIMSLADWAQSEKKLEGKEGEGEAKHAPLNLRKVSVVHQCHLMRTRFRRDRWIEACMLLAFARANRSSALRFSAMPLLGVFPHLCAETYATDSMGADFYHPPTLSSFLAKHIASGALTPDYKEAMMQMILPLKGSAFAGSRFAKSVIFGKEEDGKEEKKEAAGRPTTGGLSLPAAAAAAAPLPSRGKKRRA